MISQLVFWIVVNIAIGFSFPFIDNTAHIAGLITGLILGFLPHRVPPPPPRDMVIDLPSASPQNEPQILRRKDPLIDDFDGPSH